MDDQELFKRLEKGDEAARTEIVEACQPLVAKIAGIYSRKSNLSRQELMGEGYVGLLQAIGKFDRRKALARGVKFSSYAYWWVRRYITRAVIRGQSITSVPESVSEMMGRYRHFSEVLTQELGRTPTESEIRHGLDLPEKQAVRIERRTHLREFSLDGTIDNREDGLSIHEIIATVSKENIERQLENETLLERFFSVLGPVEKEVIILRFGLHHQTPFTYQEVAEQLRGKFGRSFSRQRVHQIVNAALRKIRTKYKK